MARSRRLFLIGALIFVVGAGVTLFALRSADGDGSQSSEPEASQPAAAQETEAEQQGQGQAVRLTTAGPGMPQQLAIPSGKEAMAITVNFPQSVAALPGAGDRVNVYGVFTEKPPAGADEAGLPIVQRALTDVEVLGRTGGSVESGGDSTYVLALAPAQVERVVLLSAAEKVWLTLTGEDAPAVQTTGANHSNVLP